MTEHEHKKEKSGFVKKLMHIYEHEYKKLLLIPIILVILALGQIGFQMATTGDFLIKGVSLKGGVSMAITDQETDLMALENFLITELPEADLSVRSSTGIVIIDAADVSPEALLDAVTRHYGELSKDHYSITNVGSSLGASFFREAFFVLLIAFLFMGVVVFIAFRVPAVSVAVIAAVVSDMIVTLAIINLMGVKLSSAGIGSFLLLIGYSVDTDVLLSTRVLKRKAGTVMDRVYDAMGTGMTMTCTTLVAVTIALIFSNSATFQQIMIILFVGLVVDVIMTWFQNVAILRMYLEKKKHASNH